MEIKSMSSISNTNFENFDKLKQTSDISPDIDKPKVDDLEKTFPVSEKEAIERKKSEQYGGNGVEQDVKPEEDTKSFSYDLDTSTFLIIVKDKEGKVQQYPTEELLKFKQMLKEDVKTELAKELRKK